jgi:UDP-GlcNAc3NAcA epimerase
MNQAVLTVIGARPQFIKAAPVSRALADHAKLREIIVHTGQHYDASMSDVFFRELEIPAPAYDLGVGSGTHAQQTGGIMRRLEPVLEKERPALLLIYGDTNSTLGAALTAAKLHIPVAHVEAGLRSFNRRMPEEINRIVADRLSSLLFAPTQTAVANLRNEGIAEGVTKTGDVMYDVALHYRDKAQRESHVIRRLKLSRRKYALATVHRAENSGDSGRLASILNALEELTNEMAVVLPLHPRTRKMVREFGLESVLKRITVIDPVGFLDMVCLESNARLIVTDSGGVQKEAYFHRVPCVTLRDETEWVETVAAGWNRLADVTSPQPILCRINEALDPTVQRRQIDDYGDGTTARVIADRLVEFMTRRNSS